VRDIDGVVSGYYSMSWAAPHLFGERRAEFEAALRSLLGRHSPDGGFWDWPGDTEIIIAAKPQAARREDAHIASPSRHRGQTGRAT
jgi:hypothetical protein